MLRGIVTSTADAVHGNDNEVKKHVAINHVKDRREQRLLRRGLRPSGIAPVLKHEATFGAVLRSWTKFSKGSISFIINPDSAGTIAVEVFEATRLLGI
jgi:hypothetical protein